MPAPTPNVFTLNWVHGANATSQTVKYRPQGTVNWITSANITPANPQTSTNQTATVTGQSNNVIYEFQVDTICSSGILGGEIIQGILFKTQDVTVTASSGVISMVQNPMPSVNDITYVLYTQNNQNAALQTVQATGLNPNTSFAAVASGNYVVKWAYSTIVNGVQVNSYDANQANQWYASGTITV